MPVNVVNMFTVFSYTRYRKRYRSSALRLEHSLNRHWTLQKVSSNYVDRYLQNHNQFLPSPDIDDCDSAPCGENGNCTDDINAYRCQCESGFTGEECQIGEQILHLYLYLYVTLLHSTLIIMKRHEMLVNIRNCWMEGGGKVDMMLVGLVILKRFFGTFFGKQLN